MVGIVAHRTSDAEYLGHCNLTLPNTCGAELHQRSPALECVGGDRLPLGVALVQRERWRHVQRERWRHAAHSHEWFVRSAEGATRKERIQSIVFCFLFDWRMLRPTSLCGACRRRLRRTFGDAKFGASRLRSSLAFQGVGSQAPCVARSPAEEKMVSS